MIIRRILLLIAAAAMAAPGLLGLGSGSAPASASAHGPTCHSLSGHDTPGASTATAWWTDNQCGEEGDTHTHCSDDGGNTYRSEYGGEVVKDFLKDTSHPCPAGWILLKAGWQRFLASGPKTTWYFTAAKTTAAIHGARRGCTPDIQVRRYVGDVEASWTLKCVHSVQAFGYWGPFKTVFGTKVVNGTAAFADEPSGAGVLRKADCAGYAAYNSAGQQVIRKVTYPSSGTGC